MATNRYNPDYVIHPGEYIAEILESRAIKKRDLAERIGLSVKAVSQIINGKALYSPDVALMLEKALQIDARIWINLVEAYQLHHAREKERRNLETERTRDWVCRFPAADLKRLGFLDKTTKPEVNADQLLRFFQDMEFVPVPSRHFRDVFDAVLQGTARYGIVPIENSLAGSVHENYDLLLQYPDLTIVGEIKLRVEHSLIGMPGSTLDTVKRVFSHPQALAQSDEFLRSHEWELVPFYDTAGSVAHIAEVASPENAAIANARAADVYGMQILKEGIETNPRNYTRFVVLSREEEAPTADANLASIVFSTPDKPGALFRAMEIMAEAALNLKKLESRPIPGKPWEYMFYVDLEMPSTAESFTESLGSLRDVVNDLRVLGVYRAS